MLGVNLGDTAYTIPLWWNAIYRMEYPKKNIRICIIADKSKDKTLQLLQTIQKNCGKEYLSFEVLESDKLPHWSGQQGVHPTVRWMYRWDEWLSWHDEVWFKMIKDGKADHWLVVHGDSIVPPNIIKNFLRVFREKKDCGWVGCLGKRRGGRVLISWVWKQEDWRKDLKDHWSMIVEQGEYSPIRGMEIDEEKKYTEDVFPCAFVGSAFMIRKEVIVGGATMGRTAMESAIPMVMKMDELGYRAYCDKRTKMVHVNTDGTPEIIGHAQGSLA